MATFSGDVTGAVVLVGALLLAVLLAAGWVYVDARTRSAGGRPVVSAIGSVQLRTPASWFVACLLAPEFALPEYADRRS
jgi:hypothetical protein